MRRVDPIETWTHRSTRELIAEGKLSIGDGYRAKNSELSSSGVPFARAGNIDGGFDFENADRFPEEQLGKAGDKVSRPGDVAFTSKGTVGRLAFVNPTTPRFVYSPQLCFWRSLDLDSIDARWLYYWMLGNEFTQQISSVKGQTDMADYVSLSDQRRMEITLPPPDEQRAIAGVLSTLDDKIEQNRRTAQALERLTRAIFRAWFVDFEPVKAKAAGATAFPSTPQAIFDTLPTRFVDSAIGAAPEGWEVGTLGDVAVQRRDGIQPTDIDSTTPYIGLEHMPRRSIALTEWEHVGKVTSGKARFKTGQILFGKLRPYFHKVGLAPINGVCSTDIVVLEPKASEWLSLVLGHASSDDFVAHTAACSTGTKMPRTNWRDMASYQIVVPPKSIASSLTDIIRPMLDLLSAGIFESHNLAEMRDYLLPKLLSGHVRAEIARG